MTRETLLVSDLSTICWLGDAIIDWDSAGKLYSSDGKVRQLGKYHYSNKFDRAIISLDGQYAFIYENLGTKGLLLKNGDILREINRSYYCADVYEYPVAFLTIKDTTYLIHCPLKYCRLDFENVESGALITDIPGREPSDVFHSRLEIDPTSSYLMSKGWVWHPLDVVKVFDIEACIENPLLLDRSNIYPDFGIEICTASFIDSSKILIGSSNEVYDDEDDEPLALKPKHIAIWDLHSNQIVNPSKVDGEFGNLFAINEIYAWDIFKYPKIINVQTGEIVDKDDSVDGGEQNSSIIHYLNNPPKVAFNRQTKQLAVADDKKLEILTPPKFVLK